MRKRSAYCLAWVLAAAAAASAEPFRGESCTACHATLREGAPPQAAQEKDAGSYDVIVIGGGLSGLAAAHWLKDLNVLVLEKEKDVGGHARERRGREGAAPAGDAYVSQPFGPLARLLTEEGVSLSSVPVRDSIFVSSGVYVDDWLGAGIDKLGASEEAKAGLKRLHAEVQRLRDSGMMTLPVEESKLAPLRIFDPVSFAKYLDDSYGDDVEKIGDLYSRDIFGIGADQVSAYAGLYFLQRALSPAYTGPGGLAALSRALGRELGTRVATGAFVWRVHQDADSASVEFDRDGKVWSASAKAVVFAIPGMITDRIAGDLSPAKDRALNALRYSTYVVVPFSLSRPVPVSAFKLWDANAYFTSLVFPLPQPAQGQTVVAYIPFGGEPGRRRLEVISDAGIRLHVEGDLDKMFPGAGSDVHDSVVIRWGHGMAVPFPKFLTEVRPVAARPEKRYFFAGEDTQLPCAEGAVYAGYLAAEKARELLGAPAIEAPSAPPQ